MPKNQPNTPLWARGAIGQMGMRPEVMAIWMRQDLGENAERPKHRKQAIERVRELEQQLSKYEPEK